jgi:hypothetical protein
LHIRADASTIGGMAKTMLDKVRDKLAVMRGGELFVVAQQAAISYDTALRIRDRPTYQVPFETVQRLAELLKVVRA